MRPNSSATASPSCTRAGSSPSTARPRCWPTWDASSSSCASTATCRGLCRRCAPRVSPATTALPWAPPCTCPCTTDPPARPSPRSPSWGLPSPPSPAVRPPSTTSTSSSPASRSPPEPRRVSAPRRRRHPTSPPNLNQGDPVTAVTSTVTLESPTATRPRSRGGALGAVATLARRRLAISARTPRELLIPLLAPLLFAMVVVPALADTFGTAVGGVDYMTFVAVATIGLLVPLSAMQSGLGVVVDRLGGGLRDLLAAPVSRPVIVAGNLVVAVALSSLQVAVLLGAAAIRGAEFDLSASGLGWFAAATLTFAVAMYGIAEVLANRLPSQEEYIAALPAVAIVPFFFAGSFFPISALPAGLTVVGKLLPITHVIALVRYGLAGDNGAGLHDIWGMDNTTTMASLSLGVVALFAVALTAAAVRTFQRTAVR